MSEQQTVQPNQGDYVRTRDGQILGPMRWDEAMSVWRDAFVKYGRYWHRNGSWCAFATDGKDIVALIPAEEVAGLSAEIQKEQRR